MMLTKNIKYHIILYQKIDMPLGTCILKKIFKNPKENEDLIFSQAIKSIEANPEKAMFFQLFLSIERGDIQRCGASILNKTRNNKYIKQRKREDLAST